MNFFSLVFEWLPQLGQGLLATLRLAILSFILAPILALPIALARLSSNGFLRRLAHWFIEIIRGMPSLTLLFLIYFGGPSIGISFHAVDAAVIGLGLNGAAYVSEIYRAGIQAVDSGQREAAQMLGMRRAQIKSYIVLPQAFRIVVPPIGNYSISLLKDTSVASLISAPELMLQARDLTSEYFLPLQIYIVIGGIYLIAALVLSQLVRWLERRLAVIGARPGLLKVLPAEADWHQGALARK